MNKIFSKIMFLFSAIFLFVFNISAYNNNEYINEETDYKAIIEDDANLLTQQEKLDLIEEMKVLTQYGNIAFKTINENSYSTETYSSKYYHEKFGTTSGTLFLIDMDNRYIYIFSDGDNYKTITKSKAYIITDNVYKYATNERYYECASDAFGQIELLLSGGKIAEPMRHISNILLSILAAFLINFIIVLSNTKIKKAKNKEIISNCHVKFNIDNVNAVKTGQHRVYSPVSDSSSSGGGSRSSGGGGGRSSGGGGGHRF